MRAKGLILCRSDEERVSFYEHDDGDKSPYWHQTLQTLSFFSQNPVIQSSYKIKSSEPNEGDRAIIKADLLFAGEGGGVNEYFVLEEDGLVRRFNGEFSLTIHCAEKPDTWGRRKLYFNFHAGEADTDSPELSKDAVYCTVVLQTDKFNTLKDDIQSRDSPTIGIDLECMVIANEMTLSLYDPQIHPLDVIFTAEPIHYAVEGREPARFPGDIADFDITVTDEKPVKSQKEIDIETDRELELLNIAGEDDFDFELGPDQVATPVDGVLINAKRFAAIKRLLRLIFFALIAVLIVLSFKD